MEDVRAKRTEGERREELQRTRFKSEGQPSGRYSKYLEKVLDGRPIEVPIPGGSSQSDPAKDASIWRRQVKQFVPLRRISEDEWSDDHSWYHYRMRELIEERDMVP